MAAIRVAVLVLSMVVIGHCLANEDEEQRTLPQIMQEKVKRFFEATGTMGERSEMEEGISKRFMDSVMGSDCGAFGCKRSETQEKIKRFMDSVMGSDCGAFGCKRSDTVEKLKRVLHSLSERSREQLPHGRVMAKKEAAERGEGNQRRFVGQLASECGLSCDKKRRDSPLPEDRSRRLLEQVKDGAQQISKRFMSLQSGGCDDPACKMAKRNAEARAKRLSEILSGSPKKVGTRGVDRVVGLDPETDNSDKRRDSEDTMTSALRNARESRWSAAEEMLARMAKKRRAEEEMAQRESDCNSDCLKRSAKNVHDLVDQEQEKKRYVESLLEELRRKRNEELIERRILENRRTRESRRRQRRQDFLGMITGGNDYGPFGSNVPQYGSKVQSYGSSYDYNYGSRSRYDDDNDYDYYDYSGSADYYDDEYDEGSDESTPV